MAALILNWVSFTRDLLCMAKYSYVDNKWRMFSATRFNHDCLHHYTMVWQWIVFNLPLTAHPAIKDQQATTYYTKSYIKRKTVTKLHAMIKTKHRNNPLATIIYKIFLLKTTPHNQLIRKRTCHPNSNDKYVESIDINFVCITLRYLSSSKSTITNTHAKIRVWVTTKSASYSYRIFLFISLCDIWCACTEWHAILFNIDKYHVWNADKKKVID